MKACSCSEGDGELPCAYRRRSASGRPEPAALAASSGQACEAAYGPPGDVLDLVRPGVRLSDSPHGWAAGRAGATCSRR